MNYLLELRGNFEKGKNSNGGGPKNLNSTQIVDIKKVKGLIENIIEYKNKWNSKKRYIKGYLINVICEDILPKSRRISKIFLYSSKENSDDHIKGSKYIEIYNKTRHEFTYYIEDYNKLDNIILNLEKILDEFQNNTLLSSINSKTISEIRLRKIKLLNFNEKEVEFFISCIIDISNIYSFRIPNDGEKNKFIKSNILSFYHIDDSLEIMNLLNLKDGQYKELSKNTFYFNEKINPELLEEIDYLISMSVKSIYSLDILENKVDSSISGGIWIPEPQNEPTIGVIDTLFNKEVYFGKWVEYVDMVDPNIPKEKKDYEHGTQVSSIIVDGHQLNPWLDDGCGRFKVKHFGVTTNEIQPYFVVKKIEKILQDNRDIKVWNFCLGSNNEVDNNSISYVASKLDEFQVTYDVIFIVSGTNYNKDYKSIKVGSPADSLNSIVVNSVNRNKQEASYSRKGPILTLFQKPDVSYYGGDVNELIRVCNSVIGFSLVQGTSYATPWISRKVAYLIHVLGFSKEDAKALIIESSTSWEDNNNNLEYIGYGVVPIKIDDVLNSNDDEVKFIINGFLNEKTIYNYELPMILDENNKHPFKTRYVFNYFTYGQREKGVDYTSTEVKIQFGRLELDNKKNDLTICQINKEVNDFGYLTEEILRKEQKKWFNVKFEKEKFTKKSILSKNKSGLWGIKISLNSRTNYYSVLGTKFSLVVRIKTTDAKNRYNQFINNALMHNWLVYKIDLDQRINIYNIGMDDIEFED